MIARQQLLALGLSPAGIHRRVRSGRLHPVYAGVYAVGHRVIGLLGRQWAAVLACGEGAALSHWSAGAAWRMLATTLAAMHVSAATRGSRPRRASTCTAARSSPTRSRPSTASRSPRPPARPSTSRRPACAGASSRPRSTPPWSTSSTSPTCTASSTATAAAPASPRSAPCSSATRPARSTPAASSRTSSSTSATRTASPGRSSTRSSPAPARLLLAGRPARRRGRLLPLAPLARPASPPTAGATSS